MYCSICMHIASLSISGSLLLGDQNVDGCSCYSTRIVCQSCKACNQSILLLSKHLVTPLYVCSYKKNNVYSRLVFIKMELAWERSIVFILLLCKLDLMVAQVFSLVSWTSAWAVEDDVSLYQSVSEQENLQDLLPYSFRQCCLFCKVTLIFYINSVLL